LLGCEGEREAKEKDQSGHECHVHAHATAFIVLFADKIEAFGDTELLAKSLPAVPHPFLSWSIP